MLPLQRRPGLRPAPAALGERRKRGGQDGSENERECGAAAVRVRSCILGFYLAEHGDGSHFAPFGSFLKLRLVIQVRAR